MRYELINAFLKKHFPNIEGALLFGSYISNPAQANDIDLILVSNDFSYSSKESFIFDKIKINTIKLKVNEIFSIFSKHFQQGDFYRIVFSNGVILVDTNKNLSFIKNYILNSYPTQSQDILAFSINEVIHDLTEYVDFLTTRISKLEFHFISSRIISLLVDYFLFTNNLFHLKSDKLKSRYFNLNFPREKTEIIKLITAVNKANQNEFVLTLNDILFKYNIPLKKKYSNDLIFDDFSNSELILFIENLFNFQEIKELITKIKTISPKIEFFVYQVDEDNQEKKGCYIVFNNSTLIIETEKQKWIDFFIVQFSKYQYSFPYNNIFCYPEIKFISNKNVSIINEFNTQIINLIYKESLFEKESFLLQFLNEYKLITKISLEDLYTIYLSKLNSKSRNSNYIINKSSDTESKFLNANKVNENKLLKILKKVSNPYIISLNEFRLIKEAPIWLHFQVIDRILSLFLKTDFEKMFYIHCIKTITND